MYLVLKCEIKGALRGLGFYQKQSTEITFQGSLYDVAVRVLLEGLTQQGFDLSCIRVAELDKAIATYSPTTNYKPILTGVCNNTVYGFSLKALADA